MYPTPKKQNCLLTPILDFSISSYCVFQRQWQLIMAHMTTTLLAEANCSIFDVLFKLHWTVKAKTDRTTYVPNKPRVPWTPLGFNLPRCLKKKMQHLWVLPSVCTTLKEAGKQKRTLPVLLFYSVNRNIFYLFLDDLCILIKSTFTCYSQLVIEKIEVAGGTTYEREKHVYQSVALHSV